MQTDNKKIKLSILCISYNHEKFIRKALDGFLMQKTNFPFEIIIHDDASTDKTSDIIRKYAEKYPDIIKPIFQTENQFSKNINIAKHFMWSEIKGEYVALCEGDDYWTDKYKLQKQVDFLDTHPECTICFHPVKVIWEDNSYPQSIFPTPEKRFNKTMLTIDDLIKGNFIQTNSVVYRWQMKNEKNIFPDNILPEDYFLHLLHAQKGKIGFLPDIMAVYRRHKNGIWTDAGKSDKWLSNCAIKHINFYYAMEKQFHCDKSQKIANMAHKAAITFIRMHDWEKLKQLTEIYPDLSNLLATGDYETLSQTERYHKKLHTYKRRNNILIVLTLSLIIYILITI